MATSAINPFTRYKQSPWLFRLHLLVLPTPLISYGKPDLPSLFRRLSADDKPQDNTRMRVSNPNAVCKA